MKLFCASIVILVTTILSIEVSSQILVRKCLCEKHMIKDEHGDCIWQHHFNEIHVNHKHSSRFISLNDEMLNVVVTPLSCQSNYQKITIASSISISLNGELMPSPEPSTFEWCVEYVRSPNGRVERQFDVCIFHEPFRLCCLPDEVMNDFGDCIRFKESTLSDIKNYKVDDIHCPYEHPFQERISKYNIRELVGSLNLATRKIENSIIWYKAAFGYYDEVRPDNFCISTKIEDGEIEYFKKYCRCIGFTCIERCCPPTQSYNVRTSKCEHNYGQIPYIMPKNLEYPKEKVKYLEKSMTCDTTFVFDFSKINHLIFANGTISPQIGQSIPIHFFCLGLIKIGEEIISSGLGCLIDKPKAAVYRSCNAVVSEEFVSFLNPRYPRFDPALGDSICAFRINLAPAICQVRVDIGETDFLPPEDGACIHQYLTVHGTIWPLGVSKICGHNVNNHFYIDILDDAAQPYVELLVSSKKLSTYRWALWVSQINCSAKLIMQAPPGCLQYHWKNTGSLQSFSYLDNQYYKGQDYRICFLSPRNSCKITFETDGEFMLANTTSTLNETCSHHCDGDYLKIPRGSATGELATPSKDRYCGSIFSPNGSATSTPVSSPTTNRIYYVEFVSGTSAKYFTDQRGSGFNLKYEMANCQSSNVLANSSTTSSPMEWITIQPPYFLRNLYAP